MVKFTLPENNQKILTSEYKLYLPTEKQLITELQKEIQNFKTKNNHE